MYAIFLVLISSEFFYRLFSFWWKDYGEMLEIMAGTLVDCCFVLHLALEFRAAPRRCFIIFFAFVGIRLLGFLSRRTRGSPWRTPWRIPIWTRDGYGITPACAHVAIRRAPVCGSTGSVSSPRLPIRLTISGSESWRACSRWKVRNFHHCDIKRELCAHIPFEKIDFWPRLNVTKT